MGTAGLASWVVGVRPRRRFDSVPSKTKSRVWVRVTDHDSQPSRCFDLNMVLGR